MKTICKTIFIILFFLPGMALAEADIIRFADFDWGTSFANLPRLAESHYFQLKKKIVNRHLAEWAASVQGAERYRLREEIQEECRLQLIYEGKVEGKTALITFSFTPLTQKLFKVSVKWGEESRAESLRLKLMKRHGSPREAFPAIHSYIWSEKNTEVEIQGSEDNTILDYSDLKLWETYRKERKTIKKAGEGSSQNTSSEKAQ